MFDWKKCYLNPLSIIKTIFKGIYPMDFHLKKNKTVFLKMKKIINEVVEKLRDSRKVAVLTGAGVSAESGIPTFRGDGGLWRNKDPMKLASIDGFMENSREVWEFYNWRRELISKVSPNPAHIALAELEKKKKEFLLITQNVDGLHELAGSEKVVEIHGSIWKVRCLQCKSVYVDRRPNLGTLPRCGKCGGLLRPGVVFFWRVFRSCFA